MKKLTVLLSVLALTLSMSVSAFAEEAPSIVPVPESAGSRISQLQETAKEKKAELQQRREEIGDFREAVRAERDAVKESRDVNRNLREENTALRKSLAESLKDLKASGGTLDEEAAAQMKQYNAELKSITEELRSTKGDIREVADENKEYLRDLDYERMEAAFSEIGEIQTARNEALQRINVILKEMIGLLEV